MKKYLFYVNKYNIIANDYVCIVYACETPDVFHTMGEMYYRTLEDINRITFQEDTEERRKFWKEEGFDIYTWKDKYPYV